MKKGYVFIANSTKPTKEKAESREPISLSNVSRPCVEAAMSLGYEVFHGVNRNKPEELSCNYPIHLFDSHTYRSITAWKDNKVAIQNLSKVMRDNNIEVIHCNTPVGGMVGRLCAKRYGVKKVIYTAHGFHFYKGAPLINRTVYKWAEQIMAHWTDAIITMNQEDYESAQKFHLRKSGKVYKVHGVGITLSDYDNIDVDVGEKRAELGLKETDIICISAGDLVKRKNYDTAIRAIAECKDPRLHYLICGKGPEKENLERLAQKLNIADQIHFLGFRTDIKELMRTSDIFLFTTLQEGLPRSLMEAMAVGLPVVASKIRGNVDLIENGKGGFLELPEDHIGFAKDISILSADNTIRNNMVLINYETIKQYGIDVVSEEIQTIYNEVLH